MAATNTRPESMRNKTETPGTKRKQRTENTGDTRCVEEKGVGKSHTKWR